MSDPVGLLAILLSVVLNAFFAGFETGLTSARRVRLAHWAARGRRGAERAARLVRRREESIVGALIGNNLAVVAGTSVATALAIRHFGEQGEAVAGTTMAVLNIVFGEILPKATFRARPEALLVASAPAFDALMLLLGPLRAAAVVTARGVLWLLGERTPWEEESYTRAHLRSIFAMSRERERLARPESVRVTRFLAHAHRPLRELVTPLERVHSLPADATREDLRREIRRTGHSRLPAVDARGEMVGLVLFHDLIRLQPGESIVRVTREILRLPETMSLDEAIAAMRHRQVSLAAVCGAGGRSVGIVTLEDLLEPLVGRIDDEHDPLGLAAAG